MRKLILSLLAMVAICSAPDFTLAGWGSGFGPVGPSNAEAGGRLRSRFFGRRFADDAPVQMRVTEDSRPCVCPTCGESCAIGAKPCQCQQPLVGVTIEPNGEKNFGLQKEKLNRQPYEEHTWLDGKEITKHEGLEVVGGRRPKPDPEPGPGPKPEPNPALPDDKAKVRFTVIGADADRKIVMDDLAKSNVGKDWVVRDYPPTHWHVAQAGFKTDGHPTIYLQAADGKVLHRQDDYAGPEDLQAIRKADPNYKPEADPDVRKPPAMPLPQIPAGAIVPALAAALLIFSKR